MGKQKLFFRPRARSDALDIAIFIGRDNPKAAAQFLRALEYTCHNIAVLPEIGSRRSYRHPALKEVRMFSVNKFKNYLIFYQSNAGAVDIVRIIHGARDLPILFG